MLGTNMTYLNIRSTQAMASIHTQLGKLSTHSVPARLHGDYQAARSGLGATQPKISMDSYQSRHAYGYTNNTDFARENYQKGMQGVAEGRSHHTRNAWDFIDNAAKPGRNVIADQAMQGVRQQFMKQRYLELQSIPDVEITVTPAEITGRSDPGHVTLSIDTEPFAQSDYEPGSVDTELTQEGDVRQWVSYGHYDILA